MGPSDRLHVTSRVSKMGSNPRRLSGGSSPREKVSAYRARLRAQGLRPLQIWVPDTRQPAFLAEAARQSALISHSPLAGDDQAFVDAISELKFS